MKVLKSMLASTWMAAIIYSILFIIAIPVLCISAGKNILLMVLSIVIIAIGLPFIPLVWIQFSKLISLRGITAAIEEEKIYSVDELTKRLHISRRRACRRIRRILRRRILREYFFDGNLIHPTYRLGEKKEEEKE
ncbi:MAG: hypothetical protein J6D31_00920 [Clostridia bacterium]|nr:hypothetical protein [Clostridia bacterium]